MLPGSLWGIGGKGVIAMAKKQSLWYVCNNTSKPPALSSLRHTAIKVTKGSDLIIEKMRKLQALTVAPCILDDGNVAEVGDIFRKAIQGKGNNTHQQGK